MTSETGQRGVALSTRSVRMARRSRPAACSECVPWHGSQRLTSGLSVARLLMDMGPRYRASLGMAWSQVQGVDGPRRGPQDAQCAVTTHIVAQAEAASDGTASGKVITRRFL
jgi:hypothetical protein